MPFDPAVPPEYGKLCVDKMWAESPDSRLLMEGVSKVCETYDV